MANEAVLMRDCAPLYISVALESFATFLMGLVFMYLLLLITNKGRLHKPGQAFKRFVAAELGKFFEELYGVVSRWRDMPTIPLAERFGACRKVNQAICSFQLLLAALTISRWLHIGNVNGFRYLGYSLTCPPMQAELVLLIAPIVPMYRLNISVTYVLTTIMALSAWAGSLTEGELFDNMDEFWDTGDASVLVPQKKFFAILPGVSVLFLLVFVQIPFLMVLFVCRKKKLEDLGCPPGYIKLLIICQVTWIAFPAWWLIGFEGLAILHDTKLNAVGFALLNVISKATFSMHMIGISGQFRKQLKAKERVQTRKGSDALGSQASIGSAGSSEAAPPEPSPAQESWFVRVLRPYDDMDRLPSKWKNLDKDFKAFLLGRGMNPTAYGELSGQERDALHQRYEDTLEGVAIDSRYVHSRFVTPMSEDCDEENDWQGLMPQQSSGRNVVTGFDDSAASQALGDLAKTGGFPSEEGSVDAEVRQGSSKRSLLMRGASADSMAADGQFGGSEGRSRRVLLPVGESAPSPRSDTHSRPSKSVSFTNSTCAVEVARQSPKMSAVAAAPVTELPSAALNGHTNGHSAHENGNTKTLQELQQLATLLESHQRQQEQDQEVQLLKEPPQSDRRTPKPLICCHAGLRQLGPTKRNRSLLPSLQSKKEGEEKGMQQNFLQDLMIGQFVTTMKGDAGRVVQKTSDSIVIMSPQGGLTTVEHSDISLLFVTMVGARGIDRIVGRDNLGKPFATCSCEIEGKPTTRVRSPPVPATASLTWRHEATLLGYAPGDNLVFTVARGGDGDQGVMASAVLSSDQFRLGCLESEVQLSREGELLNAFVTVVVMAVKTPNSNAAS